MNRSEFMQGYWHYYLLLEEKFSQTLNYVEIVEDNFSAYSVEYAYLLQSIGGELDSFFKQLCGFSLNSYKTMKDYKRAVLQTHPSISSQEIDYVHNNKILLQPFASWSTTAPQTQYRDTWWEAYTQVKHNRPNYLKKASQGHVLYALSGLFLLEMTYLKDITAQSEGLNRPEQESNLFELKNWEFNCIRNEDAFLWFMEQWHLPT